MLAFMLLLVGCLEKVTQNPPPLDERFFQGGGKSSPSDGPSSAALIPFADYEGPWVKVSGTTKTDFIQNVDMDLWSVDPNAPGNRKHLGKIPLGAPGVFELKVPKNFGGLQIEAFQDFSSDGPTNDDPFAFTTIIVEDDIDGIILPLVVGAREAASAPPGEANAPEHQGAPGGAQHVHTEVGPGGTAISNDPFSTTEGDKVIIKGIVHHEPSTEVLDMDIFRTDPNGPGGRIFAGKKKLTAGPFELMVPLVYNEIVIEVFVDRAGDGPSAEDPFAPCPCNPLKLSGEIIDGIEITVQ